MEPRTERLKSLEIDSEDVSVPYPSPKVSQADVTKKEIKGSNKKEKLKTDYSSFIINLLEKPYHSLFGKKKNKNKNKKFNQEENKS